LMNVTEREPQKKSWSIVFRRAGWMITAVLLVSMVSSPAHALLGIDDVLAALAQLNSMMRSTLGGPLQQLQSIQQQFQQFEQQTVYPPQAIQQVQQLAGTFSSTMQQMNSVVNTVRSSAQLPVNQRLEQMLLSKDPNNVAQISAAYTQVYGSVPTAGAGASPELVTMVDMTDAQAQDAMKKAIQLDALADREMEVSQDLLNQIQNSAPGTAPILSAQAAAWVLQANAYSQSGMAELLRTRSASISSHGALYKYAARNSQNSNGLLNNLLQLKH